jgi:predicted DNA-binding transcriptional regulator AlpA
MVKDWPKRIAYNIEEAMFASGLSRRSLIRAMESGQLPSAFVMGRRRISPEARSNAS